MTQSRSRLFFVAAVVGMIATAMKVVIPIYGFSTDTVGLVPRKRQRIQRPRHEVSLTTRNCRSGTQTITSIKASSIDDTIVSTSLPSGDRILSRTNVTLNFPSFMELTNFQPGQFVASDPFVCSGVGGDVPKEHLFRIKLYPKGSSVGGSSMLSSSPSKSGFGMAYKVLSPVNQRTNERVGMYLQYLGEKQGEYVDATFAIRLKGRQRPEDGFSRRFDVEWRAGMRFVPLTESNLQQGRANDFGANLMQTSLLQQLMGVSNDRLDDTTPLKVEVEVIIHDVEVERQGQQSSKEEKPSKEELNSVSTGSSFFGKVGRDIRLTDGSNSMDVHDTDNVRVGKIVVPLLSRLLQRPRMFELGAYPGVEYRILRILKDGKERFTSCPGADYELKPIYPLVSQLERTWPVTVNEKEIPRLYTPSMYNIVSAVGSLATAMTGLLTAFILSQAISLFFIPSKSMDPTLLVGDVLLVDKVSPRLFRQEKINDIILFTPPSQLQDIVAKNGGRLSSRDLFVKRIAASPGDRVTVTLDGSATVNGENVNVGKRDLCETEPLRLIEKYIQPINEQVIEKGDVFVLGDCSSVSVDSRVWGPLGSDAIVGKPIIRLWPLERFGPIQ
jgi:signal peptidase I